MKSTIVLLPGDGIGPEVVREGQQVLAAVAARCGHEFSFSSHPIGGVAIDAHGDPLPAATLSSCRAADAILLGAVGDPKFDAPGTKVRPEQGLLGMRKALGLFANLRPIRVHPALAACSPLKPSLLADVDILFVRELTGGAYFGQPRVRDSVDGQRRALDTMVYTEGEIARVVKLAFRLAGARRRRVTSVDKANVLESSRLWREVTREVAAGFPDVALEHQLVDSCAMRLISAPRSFDVLVTENMFGDILTDEAAVLAGSLGLIPSASLGEGRLGVYEPIHGSAPDIAGKGIANPIGTILSTALLLRHSLGLPHEADLVERAVDRVIVAGARTVDMGAAPGEAMSTTAMGEAIRREIALG